MRGRRSALQGIKNQPITRSIDPGLCILKLGQSHSLHVLLQHTTKPTHNIKMSSCLGFRKKSRGHQDTQPLLPQYEDDSSLQRRVHQKLHSYQMMRALSKGFMPSTEQLIINLRTLIASDILNPDPTGLSDSGRLLMKYAKQWLIEFIELLRVKNDRDQIQDFIWFLIQARITVDAQDIIRTANSTRARADASAGESSTFSVIGELF